MHYLCSNKEAYDTSSCLQRFQQLLLRVVAAVAVAVTAVVKLSPFSITMQTNTSLSLHGYSLQGQQADFHILWDCVPKYPLYFLSCI